MALSSGNCQELGSLKSVRMRVTEVKTLLGACEVLKRKYGSLRSSQLNGSQFKVGSTSFSTSGGFSSGNYLVLQYVSMFSNLSVEETLTWKLDIGSLELESYGLQDLNSPTNTPAPNPSML